MLFWILHVFYMCTVLFAPMSIATAHTPSQAYIKLSKCLTVYAMQFLSICYAHLHQILPQVHLVQTMCNWAWFWYEFYRLCETWWKCAFLCEHRHFCVSTGIADRQEQCCSVSSPLGYSRLNYNGWINKQFCTKAHNYKTTCSVVVAKFGYLNESSVSKQW